MTKICVYTCITGDYDDLHEIEIKEKNVDYLCFTNNKNIKSKTWRIIYIEQDGLDNQRLSRKIKMLGHPIILENYDISVWMDASVIFKKSIKNFVSTFLKKNSFAAFKHTYRDCIYEEALECIRLKKDKKDNIIKHIAFLKNEKYPKNNGLYEMTVFIKKHNDKKVKETMKLWFDIICNYSKRDQLSFMYCVWKTGLKIDTIDLSVWNNDWFKCVKHSYKSKIDTYSAYYKNENEQYNPDLDSQSDYKIKGNTYSFNEKVLVDTNIIEIQVSDVPCVEYKNLKITGLDISEMYLFNTIKYNEYDVFYNNSGIIQLIGNFKKNQEFSLSIDFRLLNETEKIEFIESLCIYNIEKDETISGLKPYKDLYYITINSKSWKITKPLRLIINKLKKIFK